MNASMFAGFALLMAVDTLCQVGCKLAADLAAPATFDAAWLARVAATPWIYLVGAGYLVAFALYMTILKTAPVGLAFAVTHLEIVSVLLVSVFFLGETLNAMQLTGCLAILAGVGILCSKNNMSA
jgi:drug/metabolite transporter (DMT)-like permease